MYQVITNAVDWVSVKLTTLTIPFLFIGSNWVQLLGAVSIASTIIYNGIKIYKELKKKKENA